MTSILPPRCNAKTALSGSWCSEAMRRNFGTAGARVLYPVDVVLVAALLDVRDLVVARRRRRVELAVGAVERLPLSDEVRRSNGLTVRPLGLRVDLVLDRLRALAGHLHRCDEVRVEGEVRLRVRDQQCRHHRFHGVDHGRLVAVDLVDVPLRTELVHRPDDGAAVLQVTVRVGIDVDGSHTTVRAGLRRGLAAAARPTTGAQSQRRGKRQRQQRAPSLHPHYYSSDRRTFCPCGWCWCARYTTATGSA